MTTRPSLAAALDSAVEAARALEGGRATDVYPTLARVDRRRRAAAVHPLVGEACAAGDSEASFILMSVAKPFALALAADLHGAEAVVARTGMTPSPYGFNDPVAITAAPDGRTNPMVNPGAITVASLLTEGALREGLSAFAGRRLDADPVMVDAIHATNHRNRLLAGLLEERGLLGCDLERALHLYTYQSCVAVTAADLARMGAALAGGGRDPVSGARVVSEEAATLALRAMEVAGLYTATEDWMRAVGLPAKSGIAGGLLMVSPGVGALAAYSPPLDAAGNPVAAQAIARALAADLLP